MTWFTKNITNWLNTITALWDSLTINWDSDTAVWDGRGKSKWYNKNT